MTGAACPQVSIVIPVRDRQVLLARALQSVVQQTETSIEVIVVDDFSDVPIDLGPFADAVPTRLVRNDEVLGAQRSRLIGAVHAKGRYVALLDSDDWWSPDKLSKQLAAIERADGMVVSCRVVAIRGGLRKEAPWRGLREGERVENFLYVDRGMLQTSTMMAPRETVVSLLEASAEGQVHNDTMLFLEAQRRGLRIVQMPEALSFFDDNPRCDRVSYDAGRVEASEAWFHAVSHDWSNAARRGFMLTDMVTRYVNTGQRGKAVNCLLRSYHPKLSLIHYLKRAAYVACNGSPFRFRRMFGITLARGHIVM